MIICAYVRDQSVPHAVADGIANKEVQKGEGGSRWIKESVAEQENTISADMGSGRRTQLWLLALLGCSIVAGVSSS